MGFDSSESEEDDDQGPVGSGELYVTPSSESDARARRVLPTEGSEDVSSLLGSIACPVKPPNHEAGRDYLPDTATDWVIDVRFDGDPRFDRKRVAELFAAESDPHLSGSTIFGLEASTNHWTYLIAKDRPQQVTRLKVAWDFVDFSEDNEDEDDVPSTPDFAAREAAVRKAAASLGKADIELSLSPEEAVQRARWLSDCKSRLDYEPTVALRSPKGKKFEGRDIWDVMLCLGLRWGDMDLFHWENPGDAGDDFFFSVWSSTPPGYFFPEEIAAGNVRVKDLVFGFSAPRCAQPGQVFESMVRAVRYAQQRLGGTMPSDAELEVIRQKVRAVEQELTSNGFAPGGDSALMLF